MRVLTVDVEDWFHILDNDETCNEKKWRTFSSRVENETLRLLDLFETQKCQGTFFILGYIARNHPDLVKEIAGRGHHIATHGDMHQLVFSQTENEFEADLLASMSAIEKASGVVPTAYRAPGFSLTKQTLWAFDVLAKHGIEVDGSVFPSRRTHGGFPDFAHSNPCTLVTKSNRTLRVFPLNTFKLLGRNVVFSGGGYFRLTPLALLKTLFRDPEYLMTYFHPRDFDPDQPIVPGLSISRRFKSYVGLSKSYSKLESLLKKYEFISLHAATAQVDWEVAPIVEL